MNCNNELLKQSLSEQLSELQEEQLAQHLNHCSECREALERLAGEPMSWQVVENALKHEHHSGSSFAAKLSPRDSADVASSDEIDALDSHTIKPSDFIVDYLQPSENKDALGKVGQIEIQQFIGQGAHGVVLKGYQAELNRRVAVKLMAPHLASVVAARKRFAREARAAAAIVHPNIMPILQVDSSGQLPYLVMPYLDCQSLQQLLDSDGCLQVEDTLRIAVQIARGLTAAHGQGVVHRDVKPANILLERGVDRVMLTDFGLARAVDDATLTRSGLIAGTPHYMSPEQARGDAIDGRSDLFSLGSVVYAMLTGRPPFRAETTYGILRRVTDDAHRPIHEFNSAVPNWLQAIVDKLLNKSPADRFQTAEEVATILQECLNHFLQPSQVSLPQTVVRLLPLARKRKSLSSLWTIGAAAASLLILFCLWAFQSGVFDRKQRPTGSGQAGSNQAELSARSDQAPAVHDQQVNKQLSEPSRVRVSGQETDSIAAAAPELDLGSPEKASSPDGTGELDIKALDSVQLQQNLIDLDLEMDQLLERLNADTIKE